MTTMFSSSGGDGAGIDLNAALSVALEALPRAAFIVRRAREVVRTNEAGRQLAKIESDLIGRITAAIEERAYRKMFDVTILPAVDAVPHHLAIARAASITPAGRVERAAHAWKLTPRQTDVLTLIAQGLLNKTIAQQLRCQVGTTELHVTAVLRKAGVENRNELIAKFWTEEFT